MEKTSTIEGVYNLDTHYRNKVVVSLLSTVLFITMLMNLLNELSIGILISSIVEIIACIIMIVWYKSKRAQKQLQYFCTTCVAIVIFTLTQVLPDFSNYFILNLLLLIGAFHKTKRGYFYGLGLGCALFLYMILGQENVMNVSMRHQSMSYDWYGVVVNYTAYFLIPAIALFYLTLGDRQLSKNFEEVFKNSEKLKSTVEVTSSTVSGGVAEITESMEVISRVSIDNNRAFEELAAAFQEVGTASSQQAEEISLINETMRKNAEWLNVLIEEFSSISNKLSVAGRNSAESHELLLRLNKITSEFTISFNELLHNIVSSQELVFEVTSSSKLIKQIADSIQHLSLNAAIEAAHAGKYGRGFSVVAKEVRKLAQHTGELSKVISEKANKIERFSDETKQLLELNTSKVEDMTKMIEHSTQAVTSAFFELDRSIEHTRSMLDKSYQIKDAVHGMGETVESFSSTIEETTATVEEVLATVDVLADNNKKNTRSIAEVTDSLRVLNSIKVEDPTDGNDGSSSE